MESKLSRSISLLPKKSKPSHPPVKIEPSYFIPVSKHRIIEKLVQDLEANGATVDEITSFKEFASIVEALLHLDAQKTLETMKGDYAVFAPPAKRALEGSAASYATEAGTRVVAVDEKKGSAQGGGSGYARRSSWMAVNSPSDVLTRMAHHRTHEERFFQGFVELMKKGNFSPISREQAETASKVQYMFTMPIDVNWKYICSVTMQRQRALLVDPIAFPHIRSEADLPDFANHFLVFYRGVSVDRRAGLFLLPKVNLVVEHLRNALFKLVRPLLGLQESAGTVNPAPTPTATAAGSLPISESQTSLDSAAVKTDADEPQYIERRNLLDSWNQANDVLKWFTSEVYVQEPTYERLVLVYRESADLQKEGESLVVSTSAPPPTSAAPSVIGGKAVPTGDDAKTQAASSNTDLVTALEKEKQENLTGHVHIKFFKDVPMADLEVTYPEKSVKMAPAESFKLYISLALGLVFLLQGLFSEETESASYMVFVTSLLGYAVTSYFQFVAAMNMYHALLNDTLFQKSLDNDIGVLLVLTDAMEEQEFNETILAYYFLWRRGKMTPAQLKGHCEQFLRNKFSVKSSFEVYDALQKLEQRKLAKSDIPLDNVGSEPAEIVFENYPVEKAIEKLQKQWAQYEFRGF